MDYVCSVGHTVIRIFEIHKDVVQSVGATISLVGEYVKQPCSFSEFYHEEFNSEWRCAEPSVGRARSLVS